MFCYLKVKNTALTNNQREYIFSPPIAYKNDPDIFIYLLCLLNYYRNNSSFKTKRFLFAGFPAQEAVHAEAYSGLHSHHNPRTLNTTKINDFFYFLFIS